jgi:PmbA protein
MPSSSSKKELPLNTSSSLFAFDRAQFQQHVEDTLAVARRLGASDAAVDVSEGVGLSVSVRKRKTENVERNRDKGLSVSVYMGQRSGHANTSDFSRKAIERTVRAALDIARYTAEDAAAGLPDAQDIVSPADAQRDLDLFHPWDINAEQALHLALQCEAAALRVDKRIKNSEGASVSAQQSHFFSGNSRGFRGGYAGSRHSLSVAPIAGTGDGMQRDSWYTSMRCAQDMASPQTVGRYAAERALSRLNARKIKTCEVPVLFESTLAAGLLGAYVQATSGGALYRKTTFLEGCLGQQVFSNHIDVVEDPHVLRAKGSSPFDGEGVATCSRDVVQGGIAQGYFLSSYSARKLGMKTTGHSGGSHNLMLTSRLTTEQDDLNAMLKKLHRGLFVVELMGQGVNYVTGDYSRGATGFWVDKGKIQYPVHEITIAGNLRDMFKNITAVGCDIYNMGAKTLGSVLIDRMKIAGN